MPYISLGLNKFNCHKCHTPCDGKTVPQFDFDRDTRFSEEIENYVIQYVNSTYPNLISEKTKKAGYPDIEIKRKSNADNLLLYLEVKVQSRTFMSIQQLLPDANLYPSETVACNLSDLERYFSIKQKEQKPIYVIWCVTNRPCITGENPSSKKFFHQEITNLFRIRKADKSNSRRFRRASGTGDIVNGEHKGVVVNYHFSLNELEIGLPILSGYNN